MILLILIVRGLHALLLCSFAIKSSPGKVASDVHEINCEISVDRSSSGNRQVFGCGC